MFLLLFFVEYEQRNFNDRKVYLPVYLMANKESLEIGIQIYYGEIRKEYLKFEVKPNDKFNILKLEFK
jgi:hypothetical protein